MLRAVVVDDSATVRSLLKAILSSDPDIRVVGTARDGAEGVRVVQELKPDVVTMDIHMPGLDGFAATKEIMITAPTPIVIVTACTQEHDVENSMSALRVGALTLLRKPPGPDSPEFADSAAQLIDTVKAMARVKVVRHHRAPAVSRGRSGKPTPIGVLAIASSTGGPQALQRLLADLPRDFRVPILIVQHISDGFTGGLASWLSSSVALRIKLAESGEILRPSTVYLAPEGSHLGVTSQRQALLSTEPPISGFRPSGTFLFKSVAEVYGATTLAVILTGMGEDGVQGLRDVRKAGGKIVAQDEATSVVFGMPAAAIRAGLADLVLPLPEMARQLTDLVCQGAAESGS
jgi:two-component system chemotaxis response regulator CheB